MDEFDLAELRKIMQSSAGLAESTELPEEFSTTAFADLGYDSLTVLETASLIERTYGVSLPEEDVAGAITPGDLVALVNDHLRAKA